MQLRMNHAQKSAELHLPDPYIVSGITIPKEIGGCVGRKMPHRPPENIAGSRARRY